MTRTRIVNATIVNEGRCYEGEVLVDGERIEQLGARVSSEGVQHTIDARGRLLMPGMIDDQVHFREPGATHKGELATESRAAVAGGITSFMEMPNTAPQTTNEGAIRDKLSRAASKSLANFAFYLGATNDNLEDVKSIDPSLTCGVKVFMGASTGNMLVDDPATLDGIFSGTPLLVATHCEDTPTITQNENEAKSRFGDDIPYRLHPTIRSEEACWRSSSMAVELAKRHGTRLHVLHLTTAKELALFDDGPVDSKRITLEACVHHLFFDDTWYDSKRAFLKCNPAVKSAADRAALLKAVADDRIDVIATDHAPHTREEKTGPYTQTPAGMPLVQHALQSVFEHVEAGHLTLEQVVHKVCHAPALCYGVRERGFLREGYFADLVLVDRQQQYPVSERPILYKCGWSPFESIVFHSTIDLTMVNGTIVWEDGAFKSEQIGRALEFQRD